MLKKLLTKSLLVLAGLCVGSNAWATDITPSATVINPSVAEAAGSSATSWEVGQIANTGTNGVKNTSGPMLVAKFDASSALSGKTLVSAYLKYDITPVTAGTNSSMRIFVIGTDWNAATAKWGDVSLTRENPITDATDWTSKTGTQSCSYDVTTTLSEDEDNVVGFLIGVNTTRNHTVTNLVLEITAVAATSATTYSIEKYAVGGGLLASESGIAGIIGDNVSAESSEATFYSGDGNIKYVFDSSNASNVVSMTLTSTAANNVLKLYFTPYAKQSCTISATDGTNDLGVVAIGSFYADEAPYTLCWSKFINVDGTYYETEADANDGYGHAFSTSGNYNVTYSPTSENIIYFGEWETAYSTASTNYEVHTNISASNGKGRTINRTNVTMEISFTAPVAGKYLVEIPYWNTDASKARSHTIYLDNTNSTALETKSVAKGASGVFSQQLDLSAGSHKIIVNCDYNLTAAMDYLKVSLLNKSATITPVGWATLYTPYALDFSGVTGMTAYTATLEGETVTLTPVDDVPANTGVVLKGDADTYSIPVIASSSTEKGSLTGSATEDTAFDAVSGKDLYMLAKNDAQKEVQFTKVTSGSIAAGKAYLPVSNGHAKLRVVIAGDDATAINGVESEKAENGAIYNLAGQRVGKDYKGIVIKNGKKFMNK